MAINAQIDQSLRKGTDVPRGNPIRNSVVTMNTGWFPNQRHTKSLDFVFDSVQNDFEQHAALYTCANLNYRQLTGGSFRAHIFSAYLENISIHIEHCNRAIEKEIAVSPRHFSFCMSLKETAPLEIYGLTKSRDCVYIIPPKGEFVTISPPDSLLMAFTIDSHTLMHNAGLIPEVAEWLVGLNRQGVFVKSLHLANRLRADVLLALESLAIARNLEKRAIVEQAILFSIASALTMEWLRHLELPIFPCTHDYERFRRARGFLQNDVEIFDEQSERQFDHLGSKRSIEQAFSDHVFMGPLAYARVVRLHNARRKLLEAEHVAESIGDIAAGEGFWDASRFAAYYRKQFGELPSATRQRQAEFQSADLHL